MGVRVIILGKDRAIRDLCKTMTYKEKKLKWNRNISTMPYFTWSSTSEKWQGDAIEMKEKFLRGGKGTELASCGP